MSPDLVAPMAAFLAHEACPVSGEIYAAGAGRFARIFIASTRATSTPTPAPTIEDVAEHWATINDETGYVRPRPDLIDWSSGGRCLVHSADHLAGRVRASAIRGLPHAVRSAQ